MKRYAADAHVHSNYSWDSKMQIPDILAKAQEKDLDYVVLTDHVELDVQPVDEVLHRIEMRNQEIDKLQKKSKIKIVKAIEVSEPQLYIHELEAIKSRLELDCVLGSIHHLLGMPIKKMAYYKDAYVQYLRSLLEMVENADINIVAHLDYIKKYNMAVCKYNTEADDTLDKILETIIRRGLTLEVNTHGLIKTNECYPSNNILNKYKVLGGKRITIGSDAHKKSELYDQIPETVAELESFGFQKGLVIENNFRKI